MSLVLLLLLFVVFAAGKGLDQGNINNKKNKQVLEPPLTETTPASQHPIHLFPIQIDPGDQTSAIGTGPDDQAVHALIKVHLNGRRTDDTAQRRLTVANLYKVRTSGFCGDSGGQWGPIEANDNVGAIVMCGEAATALGMSYSEVKPTAFGAIHKKPRGCFYQTPWLNNGRIRFNTLNPNFECSTSKICICTTRVCRFGDDTINIDGDCNVVAATTLDSGTKTIVGHRDRSRPVLHRGFDGAGSLTGEQFDRHFVVKGTAKLVLVRVKLAGALVGKKGNSGRAPQRTSGSGDYCGGDGVDGCSLTPCTTMTKTQKLGSLCGNCTTTAGNCACCNYQCTTPTCNTTHKGGAIRIESPQATVVLVDVVFDTNFAYDNSGNLFSTSPSATVYFMHMPDPGNYKSFTPINTNGVCTRYFDDLCAMATPSSVAKPYRCASFGNQGLHCTCHSGQFLSTTPGTAIADIACISCTAGKFSDNTSITSIDECKYCGAGKFSPQEGSPQYVFSVFVGKSGQNEKKVVVSETNRWSASRITCVPPTSTSIPNAVFNVTVVHKGRSAGAPANSVNDGGPLCTCNGTSTTTTNNASTLGNSTITLTVKRMDEYTGWVDDDLLVQCKSDDHCEGLCPASKYSDEVGLTFSNQCKACPTGKSSGAGASNCVGCPIGSRPTNTSNGTSCTVCGAGKYLDQAIDINNYPCKQCPVGKYIFDDEIDTPTAEQHSKLEYCIPCNGGRWYDNQTQSCHVCPTGKIRTDEDAKTTVVYSCQDCPVGQYNGFTELDHRDKHNEDDDCVTCPTGQFTDGQTGLSFCSPCAAGKFTNSSFCVDCPTGWKQEMAAQNECHACLAGYHQDNPGQPYCLPCVPGEYQDLIGAPSCKTCPNNTKSEGTNSSRCTLCGLGEGAVPGSAKCTKCDAGAAGIGMNGTCDACPLGHYRSSKMNASACVQCPVGYSQSDEGQASCVKCSPGEFNNVEGQVQCKLCSNNTYSEGKGRNSSCINCPSGFSNSGQGSTTCIAVPPGSYYWNGKVRECAAGHFCIGQAEPQSPCKLGTYAAANKSIACVACAAGKFAAMEGSKKCMDCTPGRYRGNEDVDSSICIDCSLGEFSSETGQPFCLACDPGTFANLKGSKKCQKCPTGFKQSEKRSTTCDPCKDGLLPNKDTFENGREIQGNASTSCIKPPWKLPSDCNKGEYLDNSPASKSDWNCKLCPPGALCEQTKYRHEITHKDGWWQIPWANPMAPSWRPFAECPQIQNCGNGTSQNGTSQNGTRRETCKRHSRGILCSSCMPDYHPTSNGCVLCEPGDFSIKLVLLFSVFFIVALIVRCQRERIRRLKHKYGHAWRDIVRIITINVGFAQINSTLPQMNLVSWPTSYLLFLEQWDFVNFNIFRYLGLSCIGEYNYSLRLLFVCAVPTFIVLAQFMSYRIAVARVGHLKEDSKQYKAVRLHVLNYLYGIMDRDNSGQVDLDEFKTLVHNLFRKNMPWAKQPQSNGKKTMDRYSLQLMMKLGGTVHHNQATVERSAFLKHAVHHNQNNEMFSFHRVLLSEKKRIRGDYFNFTLVVLFILHAPVSNRLFRYFDCVDLSSGSEQRHYLRAGYDVRCHTDDYSKFSYGFVVPFLIAFTLLLPLVITFMLCRYRKQLYTPKVRQWFGFIYAPFNSGSEFWEIHEIARRTLLTGVLIFIPGNVQLAAAILICVTAVASLHYFQPHRNRIVLYVAQVSFLMTTFKYVVAVVLKMETTPATTSNDEELGLLLIGMDVLFAAGCVFCCGAVVVALQISLRRGTYDKQPAASDRYTKIKHALRMVRPAPSKPSLKIPRGKKLSGSSRRPTLDKHVITQIVSTHAVNQTKKVHNESMQRKKKRIEKKRMQSKERLNRRLRERKRVVSPAVAQC